ncbi:preprotein translocase subunit SecY [Lactobacillus sp. ESL0230]|nr:preprotein translocase subunit SecY [Lactobacillus sp. ESL0230]
MLKKENRKNIWQRVGITIGILFFYDLLTYVTIPGIDANALVKLKNNPTLTMMSTFSGGGFQNLSLLSLGVSAFISAQIITQLLQSGVVPKLTEWGKQGQVGREKLTQFTRILTIILGFTQAVGVIAGINELSQYGFIVNDSWWNYFVIALLMTAGGFIAIWLGDQITQYGLGNGISIIIAAGIIKRLPSLTNQFMLSVSTTFGEVKWDLVILTVVIILALTTLIVWFNCSEYRIQIQYTRRENKTTADSYLPLKLLVPGVVPVIFASSILTIPQTILLFFQNKQDSSVYRMVNDIFSLNSTIGTTLYALLIVLFTYLYSLVQIEPDKLAVNLGKQDAYIPEVIPGDPTALYIKNILFDLGLPGSMFLVFISVIPLIAANTISSSLQIGLSGSSLLIIIGVLTDMGRQIKGLKLRHGYSNFMSKEFAFN